ncbi:T9SS type A sorting domain-containing protein [Chryseobacterium wangxinyae]|uniref:T9SS type A sorting domain-containing protein n=1 Tax=Chryseobacterium sp. CY350 TaxID=2997336 RepID=UPI00226DAF47|nr:T9SS type A sorting domain-containing protein [Chryseobacterium sp. CY350]MCY0979029.1 T9SS type A sorting domain-containing protein [Chryseobacterium sp. CY350]WBZ97244.1 T9SS type A sorting domain-containing protein [Chryseobacterium sp. CY350]
MKTNRFFGIASLAFLLASSGLSAQYYYPVSVSGFTQDVIANGVGNANTSTTTSVDAVDFAYVAKDFQSTATSPVLSYGLPVTGQFMTVNTSTPGLTFQLAPYSGSNAIKLSVANDVGTLTFATPTAAYNLYFLATGGSGDAVVGATVNFSDGTSQAFTNLAVSDWYDKPNFAIQGIGRINIVSNVLEDGAGINPRIYQIPLAITAANQTKTVQSVAFTKTSGSGFVNIFGVSADKYTTCLAPTASVVSAITASSATLSWTAPATAPSSYDVYYTSSTVAPAAATTPSFTGVTGTIISMSGLSALTKYHVWIRSNCSGNVGQWAYATTFKSACGAVTSLSENFDSYATGTTFPDCWARFVTTGTLSISSTTPASGNRNVYQTSSTTQVPTTAVLPEFSNISAGTHWLKLKARVNTATGTLNVGYVTNPTDPSTFVLIQALSIANTNYTSTNPEYTVIVPSSVPANARLAIRNTADGKGYYWDDVVWEAVPSCFPPTALTTSAITATSATLSWTAPTAVPASGYEYAFTTTNVAPTGSGTSVSGTTATIALPSPSTTYYLWVRSKCTATSASVWMSATVATKAINDECSAPVAITPGATFGTNPVIATTVGATTTSDTTATHSCQNTGYNETWYSVIVPASGSLTIETQSATGSSVTDTVLGVYTGSCGSLTQVGCDDDGSTDGLFSLVTLTGQTPGATLLISAWNYSSSTNGQFRISAYDATLATAETSAVKKEVKVYPNPFKDVIYISETKDIKSVTVYDVAGRIVKQLNDASKEINLSEVKEGLYMIKVSFKDGTESVTKAIKK